MERDNVEIARRLYPGSLDLVPLIEHPERWSSHLEPLVDPDFETVGAALAMSGTGSEGPDSSRRSVQGFAGFIDTWRAFVSESWEAWIVTATDFVAVDETRVLVRLDIRGRSKTHGVEVPIDSANLLTFREGRLIRLELFSTWSEALAVAGLRE